MADRRRFKGFSAVKVIVASGFLDPKTKSDMILAGVKRFVQKLYVLTDVLDIVDDMLSGS